MTNSKAPIDTILKEAQSYIDDDEIKSRARKEAKTQLLQLIKEAKPEEKEILSDMLNQDNRYTQKYKKGYNQALDDYEANIKALFGSDKDE